MAVRVTAVAASGILLVSAGSGIDEGMRGLTRPGPRAELALVPDQNVKPTDPALQRALKSYPTPGFNYLDP